MGAFVAPFLFVAQADAQALISSDPILHFSDNNGQPLVGGKLFTYQAGTTTKLATYTGVSGVTANPNPIILNARGEAQVWLSQQAYKFVLAPANDTDPPQSPYWVVDNIKGSGTGGGNGPPVVGPTSSVVNDFALFNSVLGTPIADAGFGPSNIIITGGSISGLTSLGATSATVGSATITTLTSSGNDTLGTTSALSLNVIGALLAGSASLGATTTGTLMPAGHIVSSGATPTVGSGAGDCGTSPVISGNDTTGRITVGTSPNGGKCTVTFGASYTGNAPVCSVWNETSESRLVSPINTSTSLFAITAQSTLATGDKLSYHCVGFQ
jgi:hypothetical protein